jgi:hypothetical protein
MDLIHSCGTAHAKRAKETFFLLFLTKSQRCHRDLPLFLFVERGAVGEVVDDGGFVVGGDEDVAEFLGIEVGGDGLLGRDEGVFAAVVAVAERAGDYELR